jgi:hypothetical protein
MSSTAAPIRTRVREAAQTRTEQRSGGAVTSVRETPHTRGPVKPVSSTGRTHGVLGVSGRVTKNMGDYNSVTCEIYCELPFENGTPEGARAFYPLLSREVDHLLAVEIALATGEEPPVHPDDAQR